VIDLKVLGAKTMWIDCDVLQADGGTRTASITGAYIAAQIAIQKLMAQKALEKNPFKDSVAAVSAGIYKGTPVLDLDYLEDRDAEVDANIVMTGTGKYVEVQSSGEEATYSEEQLNALIALGKQGIETLSEIQKEAIASAL
jgi:ribonuclease PH